MWTFLKQAVTTGNKLQAFRDLHCGLNDSAPYRIWKRFSEAQSSIRTKLGQLCKVTPEEVLEAINIVLPHFHGQQHNQAAIYRLCIEKGLLRREQIAPNTFSRMVAEMLKEDVSENKRRLAFSMQYAI